MTLSSSLKNLLLGLLAFSLSCASAGDSGPNRSGNDPLGIGSNVGSIGRRLLNFRMTVNPNGQIDRTGRGTYAILINAQGTPIEATDLDTFTDFIRFDGQNFDWFHRLGAVGTPGFTFGQVGPLSGQSRVSPDGRTIDIIVDVGESTSFINQFVPGDIFTVHAITTDTAGGSFLGRLLDTIGQGPNINGNSLQTITVRKGEGATQPIVASYPFDPLIDTITHSDLGGTFPYANFDIVSFEVTAQ